jgi:small multidrug resistance pump
VTDPLRRFSGWFYAAAAYNLAWGGLCAVAPATIVRPLGVGHDDLVAWQVVGMLVLVYAPAYCWVARRPSRHPHLVAVALLGKALGLIGFVWATATGTLPLAFGLTIATNDVVWLVPFFLYLRAAVRLRGGFRGSSRVHEAARPRSQPPGWSGPSQQALVGLPSPGPL